MQIYLVLFMFKIWVPRGTIGYREEILGLTSGFVWSYDNESLPQVVLARYFSPQVSLLSHENIIIL